MAAPARPFRFAAELHSPIEGSSWADSVREIEALGYSTLFVPDHFDEGLGPIAAMSTAAVLTTTLNVGSLVFDCDFRHPAVLARELATIDQLSEGRLEVGLGAGWKNLDYVRSGIPMDSPKVRVDRMIETVAILRGLFSGEPVTYGGEHFRITDLTGTPTPHRPGGPKFLIGGGGKRVLTGLPSLSLPRRSASLLSCRYCSQPSLIISTALRSSRRPRSTSTRSAMDSSVNCSRRRLPISAAVSFCRPCASSGG